jgi:7-keto-8-aminopelargonate synthetase-like enzyme
MMARTRARRTKYEIRVQHATAMKTNDWPGMSNRARVIDAYISPVKSTKEDTNPTSELSKYCIRVLHDFAMSLGYKCSLFPSPNPHSPLTFCTNNILEIASHATVRMAMNFSDLQASMT